MSATMGKLSFGKKTKYSVLVPNNLKCWSTSETYHCTKSTHFGYHAQQHSNLLRKNKKKSLWALPKVQTKKSTASALLVTTLLDLNLFTKTLNFPSIKVITQCWSCNYGVLGGLDRNDSENHKIDHPAHHPTGLAKAIVPPAMEELYLVLGMTLVIS